MRRAILLLLFLVFSTSCHTVTGNAHGYRKMDPERSEAIKTMSDAEAEARRESAKW